MDITILRNEGGYTELDPFEDTERVVGDGSPDTALDATPNSIRLRILKAHHAVSHDAFQISYTELDPFEDTESIAFASLISLTLACYTELDPFEDTESFFYAPLAGRAGLATPNSIRLRILKDL